MLFCANTSFNAPFKCITIYSVLANLMFFTLMNNASLLDIVMLSFIYCYTFISFKYCLLHTMHLNKWINKEL